MPLSDLRARIEAIIRDPATLGDPVLADHLIALIREDANHER